MRSSQYRIEIEDISNNIAKLPMVDSSVIIPSYDKTGKIEYLAGFVTITDEYKEISDLKNIIAIKKGLGQLVPSYMVPRKIIILEEFPLNVNGKIDRKKLSEKLEAV